MAMTITNARRRQSGFTLIEILVGLILMVIALAGIAAAVETYSDRVSNQAAAQHARTVRDAAQAYIADNYASLVAAATATTPATVSPATLAAGGYLPAGFNPVNGYGQTFTVKVLEPTANKLEAVVITTGGDVLSGQDMRHIAQLIGVDGGYIETAPTAVGAFGGWTRSLASYGSATKGHLATALFVTDATTQDDYLHRSATAGQPQLNRMNTDIDLAGNDLNSVNSLKAQQVFLPNGNSLKIGGVYYYGDATNAAVRSNGTFYIQNLSGARADLAAADISSSGAVTAATVHANDLYARNWFRTEGDGGWYSNKWGGGWHMSDATWIRAYNNKNVYTGGQVMAGTMRSLGRLTADEFIDLNGTAAVGAACSPSGLLARESNGRILSCVSGQWTRAGGFTEVTQVSTYTGYANPPGCSKGTTAVRAVCPAGWHVVGGGYQLQWRRDSDANVAPHISYPRVDLNGWEVYSGDSGNCIIATAVCAR